MFEGYLLVIDAAGPVPGVCVTCGGKIIYTAAQSMGLNHSATVMPMVESALDFCGIQPKDLGLVACVVGPGSFTGVRIGVCTAQGICAPHNTAALGVNALDALGQYAFDGIVCPVLDARLSQVYGAAYKGGQRLIPDQAMPITDFIEYVRPLGERFLFLGDGAYTNKDVILSLGGSMVADDTAHIGRAALAAAWALGHSGEAKGHESLEPLYLRKSQAEREREKA